MSERPANDPRFDLVLLLAALALLLFASPLTAWWSALGAPWYLPYLRWLLLILLAALRTHGRHDP